MRFFVPTVVAATLVALAANAQPSAQSGPQNAAVKHPTENNSAAPVAGANSFTEAQAKSQIEAKGYTKVGRLKKDANGVWRGRATQGGKKVPVSVDYQGNVN